MLLYVLIAVAVFVLAVAIILNTLPVFGASAKGERKARIKASPNSKNGRFEYPEFTSVSTGMNPLKFGAFFRRGNTIPAAPLPNEALLPKIAYHADPEDVHLTWFGHSSLLVEVGSFRILVDPVFSEVPSPFPFLGQPRFPSLHKYRVEDLAEIDVVLLSHDHYDHLDYPTIQQLKAVPQFITPLGVGAHLERWGIAAEKIQEFDWWESLELEGLQLTCTPARHFSARGLFDRFRTLWCSWALRTPTQNILLGADSGYGPHFEMMGERLGPFDLALLECGQYNDMWKQIHSMPEEIPLAWRDLKAERIMPIHWGAFKLAMHGWTEPVDRLLASVSLEERNKIITPLIGQRFNTQQLKELTDRWWEKIG